MHFQLEPIFKKRLQHQPHIVLGWFAGFCSCVDVKFIRRRPTWQAANQSAAKFADVDLVGEDEEGDKGLIRR